MYSRPTNSVEIFETKKFYKTKLVVWNNMTFKIFVIYASARGASCGLVNIG